MTAALEIAERDGLDALSLRSVALALGVVPPALYRYVRGVDDLLDLVVARLIARSYGREPLPADAREALRVYARRLRRLLSEHPAYLAVLQRRPILSPPALQAVDDLLGSLAAAGLSQTAAADVYCLVYSFTSGFAAIEQGRGGGPIPRSALEASKLLNLSGSAAELSELYSGPRFERALDVLIAGALPEQAAPETTPPAAARAKRAPKPCPAGARRTSNPL